MNRQIGVGDSKNVIVFHPLLTGHVIRRTRFCACAVQMLLKMAVNATIYSTLIIFIVETPKWYSE